MKSSLIGLSGAAVCILAVPALADVRPSVASIHVKSDSKLAAPRFDAMGKKADGFAMKGVDGKPKNGHPDDPSRPHPERSVSP